MTNIIIKIDTKKNKYLKDKLKETDFKKRLQNLADRLVDDMIRSIANEKNVDKIINT